MKRKILQSFSVDFSYPVWFTTGLFNVENNLLKEILNGSEERRANVAFAVDDGVVLAQPNLLSDLREYFKVYDATIKLACEPLIVKGGEEVKNDLKEFEKVLTLVNEAKIDRQSYIIAIGGGAVLDMVGFASSIAHRGVRHIRIPTTVLSQNDSGVGVKNGINYFGKKNFLGAFNPPLAVLNDVNFLSTLTDRDWRSGISEAIKVALIKDKAFFDTLKADAKSLMERDSVAMNALIYRCAELHIDHIASKDPFEKGSSRPLDFGHWAAHKLEQLTDFSLKHGEAVAIGIALDVAYSYLSGMITKAEWEEILEMISAFGFELYVPELEKDHDLIAGLEEFREHLGGKLTIMLLEGIGIGKEVNEMNEATILKARDLLKEAQADRNKRKYVVK